MDVKYGRTFGMRVDQQQCCALRQGSVLGHCFDQTLLHARMGRRASSPRSRKEADADTQDPWRLQSAVESFVRTQDADARSAS
jgi:hypothetical protein